MEILDWREEQQCRMYWEKESIGVWLGRNGE